LYGGDLADAGDGLERCVLGASAESGVGDALAGSVEACADGGELTLGERTDSELARGQAAGVGDCAGGVLCGEAGGSRLPEDCLARGGLAVVEDKSLNCPGKGYAGGNGERRRERSEDGRRSSREMSLKAGAVGECGGDDGRVGIDGGDVERGAAVAGCGYRAGAGRRRAWRFLRSRCRQR